MTDTVSTYIRYYRGQNHMCYNVTADNMEFVAKIIGARLAYTDLESLSIDYIYGFPRILSDSPKNTATRGDWIVDGPLGTHVMRETQFWAITQPAM